MFISNISTRRNMSSPQEQKPDAAVETGSPKLNRCIKTCVMNLDFCWGCRWSGQNLASTACIRGKKCVQQTVKLMLQRCEAHISADSLHSLLCHSSISLPLVYLSIISHMQWIPVSNYFLSIPNTLTFLPVYHPYKGLLDLFPPVFSPLIHNTDQALLRPLLGLMFVNHMALLNHIQLNLSYFRTAKQKI